MIETESWKPPTLTAEPQRVGVWWDVVRVPWELGERALALLGADCGAVIADMRGSHRMYWLVPTGSADTWGPGVPRGVVVLRETRTETTYIGVPPVDWRCGPLVHWCVPVREGEAVLTEANLLHQALRGAAPSGEER